MSNMRDTTERNASARGNRQGIVRAAVRNLGATNTEIVNDMHNSKTKLGVKGLKPSATEGSLPAVN